MLLKIDKWMLETDALAAENTTPESQEIGETDAIQQSLDQQSIQ